MRGRGAAKDPGAGGQGGHGRWPAGENASTPEGRLPPRMQGPHRDVGADCRGSLSHPLHTKIQQCSNADGRNDEGTHEGARPALRRRRYEALVPTLGKTTFLEETLERTRAITASPTLGVVDTGTGSQSQFKQLSFQYELAPAGCLVPENICIMCHWETWHCMDCSAAVGNASLNKQDGTVKDGQPEHSGEEIIRKGAIQPSI